MATEKGTKAVRKGTVEVCVNAAGETYYMARIHLADGSRPRYPVPPEKCKGRSAEERRSRADEWAQWLQEQEDKTGELLAKRRSNAAAARREDVDGTKLETSDEWYDRYHAYQVELGRSAARDARICWHAWVSPRFGPRPIAKITREEIESLRDDLDAAIALRKSKGSAMRREAISGKRAMNVWSALTAAFKAAVSSKRRDLRMRTDNPCEGIEPPGDRDSRKARRKTFIYPNEAAKLFACADIPLEWRALHAIAAYTYLRPGELRVLTWADVDLEHGLIHVSRAWDSRDEKVKAPKTRNGVRPVPIHASLLPLLKRMRAQDVPVDAPVLPMLGEHDEERNDWLAKALRAHLQKAGITRPALFNDTATTVKANFRSWRDSGITWLALAGVDVVKIQRRAGHDNIQTTLGYVKQAEELAGQPLGEPLAPLPQSLLEAELSGQLSSEAPPAVAAPAIIHETGSGRRDLNAAPESALEDFVGDRRGVELPTTTTAYDKPATPRAPDSSADSSDAVDAALARALEGATAEGRWDLVGQLARELESRRLARSRNVVALPAAGRKVR